MHTIRLNHNNVILPHLIHVSGLTGQSSGNAQFKRLFHATLHSLMMGQWGAKQGEFDIL